MWQEYRESAVTKKAQNDSSDIDRMFLETATREITELDKKNRALRDEVERLKEENTALRKDLIQALRDHITLMKALPDPRQTNH